MAGTVMLTAPLWMRTHFPAWISASVVSALTLTMAAEACSAFTFPPSSAAAPICSSVIGALPSKSAPPIFRFAASFVAVAALPASVARMVSGSFSTTSPPPSKVAAGPALL